MQVIKKRPVVGDYEGNYVTELRQGDSLKVDGKAEFTIVETNYDKHAHSSRVSVVAPQTTKIVKVNK